MNNLLIAAAGFLLGVIVGVLAANQQIIMRVIFR